MKVTRFDPRDDLIVVTARVWGPQRHKQVSLAVDTAATETLITPDVLDDLGYSARQGEKITVVHSAIGAERGYTMRVARFTALGFTSNDFRIHVHDLPEETGVEGLLGLSFLRQFNYEIRSAEGRILVDRIAT